MVKHIILWQLKEEYNTQEKEDIKAGIKAGLEGIGEVELTLKHSAAQDTFKPFNQLKL